jgi:hypothetical protein
MKMLLVLSSVVLFCLSSIARETGASWVVTIEGKMDCEKISLGYNKAKLVLVNGERRSVPIGSISSYTLNGKEFTKLPLYKDGKPTGKMVFMERIKTFGELSLYKFRLCDVGPYVLDDLADFYFLYKGINLHLALDEKTLPNICKHFGLAYSCK